MVKLKYVIVFTAFMLLLNSHLTVMAADEASGSLPYYVESYKYGKFYIDDAYSNVPYSVSCYSELLAYLGFDMHSGSYIIFSYDSPEDGKICQLIWCEEADLIAVTDLSGKGQPNQFAFFRFSGGVLEKINPVMAPFEVRTLTYYPDEGYVNSDSCIFFPRKYYSNLEVLETNVKVYMQTFDTDEELSAYHAQIVNGEVNADNEADFLPAQYGVLEPPVNLSFYGDGILAATDAKFSWKQTDENYKKWTTEVLVYGNVGYKLTVDFFGSFKETGDVLLKSFTVPTKNLSFNINFLEVLEEGSHAYYQKIVDDLGDWLGSHTTLLSNSIYVRNKYSDGTYTYYSNWVKVFIDDEGNTATEYEYDDKVFGDSGQDFSQEQPGQSDNTSIKQDSEYNGNDVMNGSELDSLGDVISDGFGLLGDGGIVDMMSDFFSFIPGPIWTLILTGIGLIITIAVIKAAL